MKMTRSQSVCFSAAMMMSLFGAAVQAAEPVRDVGYFLKRLRTLDHLPQLEAIRQRLMAQRSQDTPDIG